MNLLDLVLHLDAHLLKLVAEYGAWVYGILFAIIFSETGLVVTPFLPGDSLLFVAGAIAASGAALNAHALFALLALAAILGNSVNYAIGRWLGRHFFTDRGSRWLNPKHLEKAHAFYERHGGKTIILARFLPIVRTYAPFVAGIGSMPYARYIGFCVAGAAIWVVSICSVGYFFGNLPMVKQNLSAVIVLIVLVSISPGVIAWLKARSVQGNR
jgi:membrane-associated protein